MEIKLEDILAVSVAVTLCGSTAPNVVIPIREAAARACKNVSPRVRMPIEALMSKGYENVKVAGEEIRKLLYKNNYSFYL